MRRLLVLLTIIAGSLSSSLAIGQQAQAGPPTYLLLRRPESPQPHGLPGYPAAENYDVRTQGYAYGYFGVHPRSHWSRHFGINRMFTQWSKW